MGTRTINKNRQIIQRVGGLHTLRRNTEQGRDDEGPGGSHRAEGDRGGRLSRRDGSEGVGGPGGADAGAPPLSGSARKPVPQGQNG